MAIPALTGSPWLLGGGQTFDGGPAVGEEAGGGLRRLEGA